MLRLPNAMAMLLVGKFLSLESSSYGLVFLEQTTDKPNSLKSRHIQFIALGGSIGTGLFLGIGRAHTQGGPLSILLGYSLTGVAIFGMVCNRTCHRNASCD